MEAVFAEGSTADRVYAIFDIVIAGATERLRIFGMDLRVAFRGMTKNLVITSIILLTLALGIGATTAAFSIAYSVLLRPLPFPHAERIVEVRDITPGFASADYVTPRYLLRAWRDGAQKVSAVGTFVRTRSILTGAGTPQMIAVIRVSPGYFDALGLQPFIGRELAQSDARAGAAPVAVISYRLWQTRYAAEPTAVGRTIHLDGRSYRIAGVMPAGFVHPDTWEFNYLRADAWVPQVSALAADTAIAGVVIARMRENVSLANAQAEFSLIARRATSRVAHDAKPHVFQLTPLNDALFGNEWPKIALIILNAFAVLAIACANAANLLLARGVSLRQQLAVRVSLGARRGRIIAQLLTETGLLAVAGALLGTAIAIVALDIFGNAFPTYFTRPLDVSLNWPIAGFVLATTFAVSVAAGLFPALTLSGTSMQTALADRTRGSTGRRARLRSAFVIVEIAVAVAVVIQCGLVLRSYIALGAVDPGFRSSGVTLAALPDLPEQSYPNSAARRRFTSRVLSATRALPGVTSASAAFVAPFSDSNASENVIIAGRPRRSGPAPRAMESLASDGFFSDLSIHVIAGRAFLTSDKPATTPVAIVNAEFVRRYFPNESPLGQRLQFGIFGDSTMYRTIVGVVANTKLHSLSGPAEPIMYADINQLGIWTTQVMVRTPLPAPALARSMTAIVHAIDPELSAPTVLPYSDYVDRYRNDQYVSSVLLGILAAVALLLAAGGVYGAISYAVSMRTHEFGIRSALGARPARLVGSIFLESALLALLGMALGIATSTLITPLEDSLLYSVTTLDPISFACSAFILFVTVAAASYLPAQRAAGAAPMSALRQE